MRKTEETSGLKNNICLFQNDAEVAKIIKNLALEYGFPRVKRVLTLYFNNEIRLRCDENYLYFGRLVCVKSIEIWKEVKINSKFLGTMLDILFEAGLTKAAISNVIQMTFCNFPEFKIIYLNETLISEHQFEIKCSEKFKPKSKTLQTILKNKLNEIELNNYTSAIVKQDIKDDIGVLNQKIIDYCKQTNLSLTNTSTTSYFHQMSSASNDYGELSSLYDQITGINMLCSIPAPVIYKTNLPSASIIIPAFNVSSSIIKTLISIDRQVPKDIQLEVIIVDDGSEKPVADFIKRANIKLNYEPIIIRKEKNSGISQTRNIGATVAKNEILFFIDGDIILTPNYLYEHLLRHKLINKSIQVSFKENVEDEDKRISLNQIKLGVPAPNYKNDLRITKYIDNDTMGYYLNNYLTDGGIFSILSDTNYFRSLSYGRRIGNFDLPSMVIGHNLSMPKELFNITGGFDNNIIGYGLEDALIGIKAICYGAFVVPTLSCGVYHINHPIRRGDGDKIRKEFEKNSEIIANFLSSQE